MISSSLMAHSISPPSLMILFATFIALPLPSLVLGKDLPASTISAAPSLLPDPLAPLPAPPALSPDITPLFPSPRGSDLSPSESSLPLIPSSPSPPNPDALAALGPDEAFAPSGLLPDSSSVRLNLPLVLSSVAVVFGGIWANAAL